MDPSRVVGEFDRVEWFIRQSNAELRKVPGRKVDGGSSQDPGKDASGMIGDLAGDLPEGEGEAEADTSCSHTGDECVVIQMDECKGVQFLSVYDSLRRSSSHGEDVYTPLKLDRTL